MPMTEKQRLWAQANKEHLREYRKLWARENRKDPEKHKRGLELKKQCRVKFRAKYNQYGREYHVTPNGKYSMYVRGARARKIHFDLSKEEFMSFWKKDCYYCGGAIELIGIDRIDNRLGYVASNVVSCCSTCNLMKRTLDFNEFILKCKTISDKHFKQMEDNINACNR